MDPRTQSRTGIFRLLPFSLVAGLASGCLQEPSEGVPQDAKGPVVEEPIHLTGATSTTNWPEQQDGGRALITVKGRADSILLVEFATFPLFGDGYVPVSVRGSVTLYDGRGVPALAPVDSVRFDITDEDSLVIPRRWLDSLHGAGQDTLITSLRFRVDTTECLITGFVYSRTAGRFVHSPFSVNIPSSYLLRAPNHHFLADLDTSGVSSMFPPSGTSEISFYIPGSPHYWRPESFATLTLGPLPKGPYPLRLVRLEALEGPDDSTLVEIFEVVMHPRTIGINGQPGNPPRFAIGSRLRQYVLPGKAKLRVPTP